MPLQHGSIDTNLRAAAISPQCCCCAAASCADALTPTPSHWSFIATAASYPRAADSTA